MTRLLKTMSTVAELKVAWKYVLSVSVIMLIVLTIDTERRGAIPTFKPATDAVQDQTTRRAAHTRNDVMTVCSMSDRLLTMKEQCNRNQWIIPDIISKDPSQLDHLIYDDDMKIIFCQIPGVDPAYIDNIQSSIFGNSTRERSTNRLSDLATLAEITDKLHHYKKVLLVTHPVSRLIEIYNRASGENADFDIEQTLSGHSDFLRFVVQDQQSSVSRPWQTVFDMCHPCNINYDILFKLETFRADLQKPLNARFEQYSSYDFQEPQIEDLDERVFEELGYIYERDLMLYGYSLEDNKTLMCKTWVNGNACC